MLRYIPDPTCAEILVERKFVQNLDQCVRLLLAHPRLIDREPSDDITSAVSRQGDDGQTVKRRRLSSESHSISRDSSVAKDRETVLGQVLQVCCRTANIFGDASTGDTGSSVSETQSWSATAKDNASMLAAALELVSAIVEGDKYSADCLKCLTDVSQLLSFWRNRPTAASDSARTEEVRIFSAQCLGPCLHLMQRIRTLDSVSKIRESQRGLEKLVALNIVLPLRRKFFERCAKSWKSQRRHVTWSEIRKVYSTFIQVFDRSASKSRTDGDMEVVDWAKHVALIYDAAVRILPRGDQQRKQQEQPWLDALLLFLSYLSCPQLPKLEISQDGSVEVLDPTYPSDLNNAPIALSSLLETAMKQNHRPSLPTLGYLTSSIVSWDAIEHPWSLLAQLAKLDVDVLVSNSGLVTSTFALEGFLQKVDAAVITPREYEVLRDQVVVPLLEGYARSRALKDFIGHWSKYLQEALRKSSLGVPAGDELPAVLIWQDEDLFDRLSDAFRSHGTPTLTKTLVAQLQDSLKELADRKGTTLDVAAHVAIATPILDAASPSDNSIEKTALQDIVVDIRAALSKRSDYQGQRWRLWKLLRVIQQNFLDVYLSPEMLSIDAGDTRSLINLSESLEGPEATAITPAIYREHLERFSWIAEGASPWARVVGRSVQGRCQAVPEPTGSRQLLTVFIQKL